jgi:hypothetical protein
MDVKDKAIQKVVESSGTTEVKLVVYCDASQQPGGTVWQILVGEEDTSNSKVKYDPHPIMLEDPWLPKDYPKYMDPPKEEPIKVVTCNPTLLVLDL